MSLHVLKEIDTVGVLVLAELASAAFGLSSCAVQFFVQQHSRSVTKETLISGNFSYHRQSWLSSQFSCTAVNNLSKQSNFIRLISKDTQINSSTNNTAVNILNLLFAFLLLNRLFLLRTYLPFDWIFSQLGEMMTHFSFFSFRCFRTSLRPMTSLRFILAFTGSFWYKRSWKRTSSFKRSVTQLSTSLLSTWLQ